MLAEGEEGRRKGDSSSVRAVRRWVNWFQLLDWRKWRSPTDRELITFSLGCICLSVFIWSIWLCRYLIRSEPYKEAPVHECERVHPGQISPSRFYERYILSSRPFVMEESLKSWRAFARWADDSYLLERVGYADVRVNVANTSKGFGYKSASWWTTFERFLDVSSGRVDWRLVTRPRITHSLSSGKSDSWPEGQNLLFYLNLQNLTSPEDSFAERHLGGDFAWPEFARWLYPDQVNFWMGGPGVIESQLHYDGGINLLAQVSGTKTVHLLPPSSLPFLYLDLQGPTPNFSPIDLEAPDVGKYPLFARAPPAVSCVIRPGDLLHIPAKWFHQVRSEGRNLAVNFWYLYPSRGRALYMRLLEKMGYAVA